MEFLKLIQALLEAKSIKAALALLATFFIEVAGPALEFVVAGILIMLFEIITGVLVNIKTKGALVTGNAPSVVFKITLYPMCVLAVGLIQQKWLAFLPLTEWVSGYIVVHEFEQAMFNVRTITGWNLQGPVKLIKEVINEKVKPWLNNSAENKKPK